MAVHTGIVLLQHVVEEVLSEIIPFTGPVHLSVDYSEKTYRLLLTFVQEVAPGPDGQAGVADSILDKLPEDSLSLRLVRGFCASFSEPVPGQLRAEM